MLLRECDGCKYCQRMIGIGLGVRCTYDENQKYKKEDDKLRQLHVLITNIPTGCKYKTNLNKDKN